MISDMHRFLSTSLMASSPRLLSLAWSLQPAFITHCNQSALRSMLVERRYFLRPREAPETKVPEMIPMAARKVHQQKFMNEEEHQPHMLWWKEKVGMCKKPSTIHLAKRLSYSNLLGMDVTLKNGSLKEGTLNMEILQFKSRFPREVLLCRVGEFYEAVGFDACILVEYAGLNPMGGLYSDGVPKAGCPVVNLRQTLDDLTRNGFSVCIVEEVQGPVPTRSRKGRFISGHAHPGSPYVFGLAGADHDVEFPDPMPVVGVWRSAKGYCLISVVETLKTYSAEEGLTEEALVTKLRICQYHHLYLHTSLRNNSSGTSRWGEYGDGGLLWGECSSKYFEWFEGDPVQELLGKVREIYGLDEEIPFRNVTISSEHRPQPLYLGAATQIGVIPTEGIPSLLQFLLPSSCAGLPLLYIRDLLLNPPVFEIASAIQDACRLMSNLTCSIPDFTCISTAKLVKLLESKEANHIEFCRIKNVVDEILHMSSNAELSPILRTLLAPTSVATGLQVQYDLLVNECDLISQRIGEVISLGKENDQNISSFEIIPDGFFEDMESSWKGRVRRIHAEEEFVQVDQAAEALCLAITEDFLPIVSRVKSVISPNGGTKGEICYSKEHESVWFKGKRFRPTVWAQTPGEEQIKQLLPAYDAKGRKVGEEWFTTTKVDNALTRYHEACDKAREKVLELLRELSAELQNNINVLVFASMSRVISKALFSHVSEARRRGWTFPTIKDSYITQDKAESKAEKEMELLGLLPYWLEMSQGNAIPNNVKMHSLFLLTGPNGGGKSSILRSICAASILGICGLMVPAKSAIIPHFDSVMLHMKSYDSPVDGKSTFQIEMSEIRSIVTRASEKSLVLIDEICRGTETAKGTCIAGSILETLDRVGCLGIVSTHLHGLFDLPLNTNNTTFKAMGSKTVDGAIKPTLKLTDGVCRESLAFQTAQREGMPGPIIERAAELYKCMKNSKVLYVPAVHGMGSKRAVNGSESETLAKEVERSILIICQKGVVKLGKAACVTVGPREQPPPSTVGASCLYVIIRSDRKLYVGQTDDLVGRLRAHRSKEEMQDATILYIVVPGKSAACKLETLLINQLPLEGFKLVNKADGKHRNFGTSDLSLGALTLHP
ncbi:MUTL protein homolog 1 [Carex rostrata]